MSEGGWLPWKVQKIKNHRGPMGDYSNIRCQLPDPPRGMKWVKDESTREWSVVPITTTTAAAATDAVAVPISSSSSTATATVVQVQEIIPGISTTTNNNSSTNTMDNVIQAQAVPIVEVSNDDNGTTKTISSVKAAASSNNNDEYVYVEHEVKPMDTFQGICLKYNVSPTTLRQYNNFSGSNLRLGPEILIIPISLETLTTRGISARPIERTTEQINIASFLEYFPKGRVNRREAKA